MITILTLHLLVEPKTVHPAFRDPERALKKLNNELESKFVTVAISSGDTAISVFGDNRIVTFSSDNAEEMKPLISAANKFNRFAEKSAAIKK